MEKIKTKRAILTLLLIAAISSISTYFIYTYLESYEIKTIDMHLTVGNYTGFDVTTNALVFGTVMPSSYAKRKINITNINERIHKIYIKPTGELAEWITLSENKFVLKEDQSKEIAIRIDVPYDAKYGEHTGSLKIIFK